MVVKRSRTLLSLLLWCVGYGWQTEHYRQILVTSAETNGAFGLVARTLPPFSPGPGLCRHEGQLVGCYVAAGLVALTRGEQRRV